MSTGRPGADRIALTGMGLVTSLGLGAASSLAAIRSDIANFSEHETVLVNGNAYGTELQGARIARLPEHAIRRHVHGAERAAALLAPAIREGTAGVPRALLAKALWRLHGLGEFWSTTELLKNFGVDLPVTAMQGNSHCDPDFGRCQFLETIIQATAALIKGTVPIAIVGCVDSLCDDPVLERLADEDRLKSGSNPEGLVAGEAAGIFLLELESHAIGRGTAVLAYLTSSGRGVEPRPWTGKAPSIAMGLRSAFVETFSSLPGKGEEIDMVIADLNGERARAKEWALATCTIFPSNEKVRELKHPADCTGDCGAAMGAVLLAAAVDFLSGASPPANIALATSDDDGARRVLCLEPGSGPAISAKAHEQTKRPQAVPAVIEQHGDELAFLWPMRRRLTRSSSHYLSDLKRHDDRIKGNLDGLLQAGEAGWELSERAVAQGDAGEFFTASFLAFANFDRDRIAYLLDQAGTDMALYQGMVSALGWLGFDEAEPHIETFLKAPAPQHRYLGIAASAILRHDPGNSLTTAIYDPSTLVKARALRACGELARNSVTDVAILQSCLKSDDEEVRFWAAWSATLAGDREATEVLKGFVGHTSPFADRAVHAALRRMERSVALSWHKDLGQHPHTLRLAVAGAGIIGDPLLVPWLLEQMCEASLARVAGDAFSLITGVDIATARLEGVAPEGFDAGSNDDPEDGDVALDPDELLPWPDRALLADWWHRNRGHYRTGLRYLRGKPITEAHLKHVLKEGTQRDRAAAALELAMTVPGRPLFEVRAPAFGQG